MTQPLWLEPLAAFLTVLMVICNIARFKTGRIYWGWMLAIASSGLYLWVFGVNRLYGEALLQVLFVGLAIYGWWQWLQLGGERSQTVWAPQTLTGSQVLSGGSLWLMLWTIFALALTKLTDSDAAWIDGFVTAGSIVATLFLARKKTINWLMWLVVNLVSVGLFTHKALWLTAALYLFLAVMSVVGWLQWKKLEGQAV